MPKWDLARAARRYTTKVLGGTTLKQQLVDAKPKMVDRYTADATLQYGIEGKVQGAIAGSSGGIPPTAADAVYYQAFGKRLMGVQRRHPGGVVLESEADAITAEFAARGLQPDLLESIRLAVLTIEEG